MDFNGAQSNTSWSAPHAAYNFFSDPVSFNMENGVGDEWPHDYFKIEMVSVTPVCGWLANDNVVGECEDSINMYVQYGPRINTHMCVTEQTW